MMQQLMNVHEKHIFEHFAGDVEASNLDTDILVEKISALTLVHFTNRSGSNYFCDLLSSSTGRPSLHESLNYGAVIQKSKSLGIHCFSDYIRNVICNEPSIVKVNSDQLRLLIQWGYIKGRSEGLSKTIHSIISVQRNDVISQAVSFEIAHQTGKFASFQKQRKPEAEIKFNANQISKLIHGFGRANQDFLVLTSALEIAPLRIIYEELVEQPIEVIRKVCAQLDIPFAEEPKPSLYKRQANEINIMHRKMYIEFLELADLSSK
jgi:trehalose 2-sulfotransferase